MMHLFRVHTWKAGRWPWCLMIILCFQISCKADRTAEGHHQDNDPKPRLLILTDIGGDPDDQQSLIRLALYFNEFEIEGLIASASGTPGELGEAVVKPHLIEEIIEAYGKVSANLRLHDPAYPDHRKLLQKIKKGNPNRGLDYIGEDHDTEGSDWIIRVVDRADSRPLNIAIWGGQTDLFQALWKVAHTRDQQAYAEFVSRIRVYDIADQDDIFTTVKPEHPNVFYILNKALDGEDKREAVFRGMYLGGDESLTSMDWITTHVEQNHGPLGALYPLKTWTAPNPHGVMKEGDTPSWFYFLPNGLGHPDHPEWGGWGGRFDPRSTHFADAKDQVDSVISARATVWRWRPHFQHEFQARMDWCVKSYDEANHPPIVVVNNRRGSDAITVGVASGEKISLSVAGSVDPDGDDLSYRWYEYPEAGSGWCKMDQPESPTPEVEIPDDVPAGAEIHLILEVTDDGLPPLTSYRRVVLQVD